MMKLRYFPVLLGLASFLNIPSALADVFRHVDENGNVTYSNVPRRGASIQGDQSAEPPAPTAPVQPIQNKPASIKTAKASPASSPADFPKITMATQKQRDGERQRILQDELASEQKLLADAGKDQERIQRHQANIAALQRELGQVRQ